MDSTTIANQVKLALAEDLGTGDVSAQLLPNYVTQAQLFTREPMVVAGLPWVEAAFQCLDPQVQFRWMVKEGSVAQPGCLGTIVGQVRAILSAERTALNFLQTLAGTATLTKKYVQALQGTSARLLDTRKTIPGLRLAQKYAVRCGGGMNHRLGLYDAYLIKENHIKAFGSITQAVQTIESLNKQLKIEVEVTNLTEYQEALLLKPNCILLDNFSITELQQAVLMNHPPVCDLEASGGVTLDNIRAIAETGVQWISVGRLTKCVEAIDLTLLIGL